MPALPWSHCCSACALAMSYRSVGNWYGRQAHLSRTLLSQLWCYDASQLLAALTFHIARRARLRGACGGGRRIIAATAGQGGSAACAPKPMCSMPAAIFLVNLASEPSLVQVSIHMVCLPQSCAHLHPFDSMFCSMGITVTLDGSALCVFSSDTLLWGAAACQERRVSGHSRDGAFPALRQRHGAASRTTNSCACALLMYASPAWCVCLCMAWQLLYRTDSQL